MLNKWRFVRYEGDGNSSFECLMCRKQCLGSPGYIDYETKEYKAHWKYCPFCGTQWEGCTRDENGDYGPRRQRIVDAIRSYRREPCDNTWPALQKIEARQRGLSFWWVIEERQHCTYLGGYKETQRWKAKYKFAGLYVPVRRVLELRNQRLRELEDDNEDKEWINEVRIVRAYPGERSEYISEFWK